MAGRSQSIAIPRESRPRRLPPRSSARAARAAVRRGDLADLGRGAGRRLRLRDQLGKASLLVNNASIFEEDHVGSLEPASLQPPDDGQFHRAGLPGPGLRRDAARRREGNVVNIIDQRVWRTDADATSPTRCRSRRCGPRPTRWRRRSRRASGSTPSRPGPTLQERAPGARRYSGRRPRRVPLGHGPDLAEFGRTVRYLVENRSITGQMIALDGGQHLGLGNAGHGGLRHLDNERPNRDADRRGEAGDRPRGHRRPRSSGCRTAPASIA